jgi:hypothetical protein
MPIRRDRPRDGARLPFCYGAAGLTTLWCFFHGRVRPGVLLVAASAGCAPLVVWGGLRAWIVAELAGWAISVVMGMRGTRIAWVERGYRSRAEFERGEKAWNVAGAVLLAIRGLALLLALSLLTS